MKIAIMCESELLQKSLEMYLKDFKAPLGRCDFIVSDYQVSSAKPICLIGNTLESFITNPFTKEDLIKNLEKFYELYCVQTADGNPQTHTNPIFEEIDSLIEQTCAQFKQKLYEILQNPKNK